MDSPRISNGDNRTNLPGPVRIVEDSISSDGNSRINSAMARFRACRCRWLMEN